MVEYKLSQINIYPVKSLPGITLTESKVEERGLQYDRRWMLVDKENMFITQRLFPQMIFIEVKLDEDFLIFSHKRKSLKPLKVSLSNFPKKEINVEVWDDICTALEYGNDINEWFSNALDFNCKLVYMPSSSERKTSTKYFTESKNVSFADGYPFHIIGEESLNYLNGKLDFPVSMEQFRPNLVFSGGAEHDEDKWENIKIGETKFTIVKPCARCVMTTIDLNSGTKNREPLATLVTYRKIDNKIMFGQNTICWNQGTLKVNDNISIL